MLGSPPSDSAPVAPPVERGARRLAAHVSVPLFKNAYSLIFSAYASSLLGVLFWALAARLYPTNEVGRATAATALMIIVSAALSLNLDVGLIRFAHEAGPRAGHLVRTAYALTVCFSVLGAGVLVVLLSGRTFLAGLGVHSWSFKLLFILAVPLWALFALQDSALAGLRASVYVPVENIVFGLLKIGLLVAFTAFATTGILSSYVVAAAVVCVPVNLFIFRRLLPRRAHAPATVKGWGEVRRFLAADYAGALMEKVFSAVMPLIVTSALGLEKEAYFYIAWTVVTAVESALWSIAISMTAEAASSPEYDRRSVRSARRLAMTIATLVAVLGGVFAPEFLSLFGHGYSASAATLLRLLSLASPLHAIIILRVNVLRLQRRGMLSAIYLAGTSAILILGSVLVLRHTGMTGVGWVYLATQAVFAAAVPLETRLTARRGRADRADAASC